MTRQVDLAHYWPEYLRQYRELQAIAEGENPEFGELDGRLLREFERQFFLECDEVGLRRFERMLGIAAREDETLLFRQTRVYTRWNDTVPYTYRVLLRSIARICSRGFVVTALFHIFELQLKTYLQAPGEVAELERLLDYMLPANILYRVYNVIRVEGHAAPLYAGTVMANTEVVGISDLQFCDAWATLYTAAVDGGVEIVDMPLLTPVEATAALYIGQSGSLFAVLPMEMKGA